MGLHDRIKGGNAAATKQLCDLWIEEDVLQYVAPKAEARLRDHERRGRWTYPFEWSVAFGPCRHRPSR